jgi:hypothetical protein
MIHVSRAVLLLVGLTGLGIAGFGGWIAWRGVVLYDLDHVLVGTGGGLAVGGLLVVAFALGANAQVSTARDAAALRRLVERRPRAPAPALPEPAAAQLRADPRPGPRKP